MQEFENRQELTVQAKKKALRLLERQDRSEQQLIKKLKEYGYPDPVVQEAVDYVKSFHYIDDRRFAENYIRYHQDGKSRQRLKLDLYQKGVAQEDIDAALITEYEADETQMICSLLAKKKYDPATADTREQNRIMGYLMRRGFSLEQIRCGMRKYDAQKNENV